MPDKPSKASSKVKYTPKGKNIIKISDLPEDWDLDSILNKAHRDNLNTEGYDSDKMQFEINGFKYDIKNHRDTNGLLNFLSQYIGEESRDYLKNLSSEGKSYKPGIYPFTPEEIDLITKRMDYIGSSSNINKAKYETALKYMERADPEIKDIIKRTSKKAGIDDKLLLQRMIKEGAFTEPINDYNTNQIVWNKSMEARGLKVPRKFSESPTVDAFNSLGLDRYGEWMDPNNQSKEAQAYRDFHSGRDLQWVPENYFNEHGTGVTSARFNSVEDGLQAKADYLRVLQDKIADRYKGKYKRNIDTNTLHSLTSKSYNQGASKWFSNKGLSDSDFKLDPEYSINPILNKYKNGGMIKSNKRKDIERPLTLGRTIDNPIAKGPRVLAPVRQTNTIDQSLQPTNGRRRPVKFTPIELLRSKFDPDSNWQLTDQEFLHNLQAERGGNPTNPKIWREAMTGARTGQEDYSRRYTNNFALGGAPVIMSAPAIASIGTADPSNTWLGQPEQPQQMQNPINPALMNPQQQINPQTQMAYGGHMYAGGGQFIQNFNDKFSGASEIGGKIAGGVGGAVGALGSGFGLSQIGDTGVQGQVDQLKNFNSTSNSLDSLQDEWSQFQPMDHVGWRDVDGRSKGSKASGVLSAMGSGASAGAVASPFGAAIGAVAGLGVGLAGLFTGNRKAKRKAKRLNKEIDAANERALSTLETRADAIDTENNWNVMANFSAYGGPLGDNLFSDGGNIHIKPSKKGTFTAEAKKHGKSVQAFASQVLANKENYSPAMVKKANFAKNASKWSHAFGGELDNAYAQGGFINDDFRTDFTEFNTGGTHEESPLGGIPMGVGEDGQPNLVEEGETKYKDYVFSDRLNLDDTMLEGSGLPKHLKGKTFSDASKELAKESRERPNDPISKRTLKSNMAKLMTLQEGVREAVEASQENEYAGGGILPNNGMLKNRGFSGNPWDMESTIGSQYAVPNSSLSTALAPMNTTLPPESYPEYPKDWTIGPDALRYAPAVGSLVGLFTKKKPDYSNAERIERARERVDFNPIGDYLTYKPLDRNYYTNQLNAQSGATKRGIVNQSGGNRATATAGLLAADYNYNQGLGALARQSEEYNQAQRERVAGFNRGTNQYNSQGAMQADSMNAELGLRAAMAGAQMRDQERNMVDAAKSASLTNFFDNLGEIGREEFQRNMINFNPTNYYRIGRDGKTSYKNMDALSEEQRKQVKAAAAKAKRKSKSNGGFLTL